MRRIIKKEEQEIVVSIDDIKLKHKIIALKANDTYYVLAGSRQGSNSRGRCFWGFFSLYSQDPEVYVTEGPRQTIKAALDDGQKLIFECSLDDFRELIKI